MRSIVLLLLRITVGGLLAGHGAQKLFGWFGGSGLEGTASWLESLRLRPGRQWAVAAGGSEFLGGLLTVLGLLNPVGPILAIGSMLMASVKVHLGRPIWVNQGGAELTLTNTAALATVAFAGPGTISADRLFGIRLPRWLGLLGIGAAIATVYATSREELEAVASQLTNAGAEVEGDPAMDAEDAAKIDATSADASALDDRDTIAAMQRTDLEGRVGMSGADAGTAMGTGSDLGSETPEPSV